MASQYKSLAYLGLQTAPTQILLWGGCARNVTIRANPRQCSRVTWEDAELCWMQVEEQRGRCKAALAGAAVSWVLLDFKKPPSLCKSAQRVVKHPRRLKGLHRRLVAPFSFPSLALPTSDASRRPIHVSGHGLLDRDCRDLTSGLLLSSQAPADSACQMGLSLNRSSPCL